MSGIAFLHLLEFSSTNARSCSGNVYEYEQKWDFPFLNVNFKQQEVFAQMLL